MTWIKTVSPENDEKVRRAMDAQRDLRNDRERALGTHDERGHVVARRRLRRRRRRLGHDGRAARGRRAQPGACPRAGRLRPRPKRQVA